MTLSGTTDFHFCLKSGVGLRNELGKRARVGVGDEGEISDFLLLKLLLQN